MTRLPFGLPDPLRRVAVPDDLDAVTTIGPEADPRAAGMTPESVEKIWKGVVDLYRGGAHPAISLCLRREGQVVINRTIGHAHGNGPQDKKDTQKVLATPDTPFCVFSTSKAVTASVVHLLDQRGLLHIGDRVADYIPEYAAHGKESITIAHVLAHKAGVPTMPDEAMDLVIDRKWDELNRLLCDQKPSGRAGRTLAYHAVSGGFILGEIVRRVTGKVIDEVLIAEILDPLGFRWMNYGVKPEDIPLVGHNYPTGIPPLPPVSTLLTRALGRHPDEVTEMSNDPRFLTTVVPAANIVTTAAELSRFFELLRRGGELDGVRIYEPRTIRRAVAEQAYRQIDLTLGAPLRHSMGFMLGADVLSLFGPDTDKAFGHLGFTNVIGWADPERALAGGLITSGKPIVYLQLPQLWSVMATIGREAPKAA